MAVSAANGGREMRAYDRPQVLSTYGVDELVREAATCGAAYEPLPPSDRDLKEQIEGIDGALEGVKSIGTS
jgi:hypothetical protein